MRIALVHEYLNQFGGAERVLQVLSAIFPDSPIYTLFYDEKATGGVFKEKEIRTSFLQKIPFINSQHRFFPLLMPLAIEQFDFSNYDIVISISSSFAKGIITKPGTRHICYCLTPPRFLWDDSQKFADDSDLPYLIKKLMPPLITYLRIWDREAALRVDEFWSISDFVKKRVAKYYGKDSKVIYPPVNISKFSISKDISNYFFMAGRLVAYKRFDLAVRVFTKLGWPLKIAGTGPEMKRLKRTAGSNIEFLGIVSDEKLADLYSHAKAFIFPQEEDFGITPLESMASGRPVIAYGRGGALETIISDVSGAFFEKQTEASLEKALRNFDESMYSSNECRSRADSFAIEEFRKAVQAAISSEVKL